MLINNFSILIKTTLSCFCSELSRLLMILHELLEGFWYQVAEWNTILHDTRRCQTFERQIVHDGDVVERVGCEE